SNRVWAAIEANALGYGGVVAVSKATGIAESTIRIGRHEIRKGVLNTLTMSDYRKTVCLVD
ncbi:hypothetical protein MBAV_003763, partial [Candidatus Magnetobacterium bavaricum]